MLIDCLLPVRLLVNSGLLVIKFGEGQKLQVDFQLHGGRSVTQPPHCSRAMCVCVSTIGSVSLEDSNTDTKKQKSSLQGEE